MCRLCGTFRFFPAQHTRHSAKNSFHLPAPGTDPLRTRLPPPRARPLGDSDAPPGRSGQLCHGACSCWLRVRHPPGAERLYKTTTYPTKVTKLPGLATFQTFVTELHPVGSPPPPHREACFGWLEPVRALSRPVDKHGQKKRATWHLSTGWKVFFSLYPIG